MNVVINIIEIDQNAAIQKYSITSDWEILCYENIMGW